MVFSRAARRFSLITAPLLAAATTVGAAVAGPVLIDPSSYEGDYKIIGPGTNLGWFKGTDGEHTVELADGNYNVAISHSASFRFSIRSAAAECPATPGLACSGSRISFNVVEVGIQPGDYSGTYSVDSADRTNGSGYRTVKVIKGLVQNECDAGYPIVFAHGSGFRFNVDADGNVTTNECNERSGKGVDTTLEFLTTKIRIVPRRYKGDYWIVAVDEHIRSGKPTAYSIVPGVVQVAGDAGYILGFARATSARFNVDRDGNVGLNSHHKGVGVPQAQNLLLNVVNIEITPANFDGKWKVSGAEHDAAIGKRTVAVVNGVRGWQLFINSRVSASFDVDEEGNPSSLTLEIPDGPNTWIFNLAKK